jgi:predicted dehydrogenase
MAIDYVKVLEALNVTFLVIGRGEASANTFYEKTGRAVQSGGVKLALQNKSIPKWAIVATGVEQLAETTKELIDAGVKHILLEKPGGFYEDLESLSILANSAGSQVFVAYNRRYYAATAKAKEFIVEDGGVTSFNFEFTEWAHTITPLEKGKGVKEQWLLGNSSHVIDLAFYLGGKPKEMCSFVSGALNWHPSGSIFSGAGRSENGALFSYQANWAAPGRWSVEILTSRHRLIFRPMEKLQIQRIGSVSIEEVNIDYSIDNEFKPGLYLQVEAFLNQKGNILPDIKTQLASSLIYKTINFGGGIDFF